MVKKTGHRQATSDDRSSDISLHLLDMVLLNLRITFLGVWVVILWLSVILGL